jgi:Zn-dependent protease
MPGMLTDILAYVWHNFPLALLITRCGVVIPSLALHELAHAAVATLLGDPTPREAGRLTANPFRHQEHIGAIAGVLVGVGWSRPVPIRPHRMRVPDWLGGLLTLVAGPLTSAGLAALGLAGLRALGTGPAFPWAGWPHIANVFTVMAGFNLTAALLNLLPLFPLDMWAAIRYALPLRAAGWWERRAGWTTAALGVAVALLMILPPRLVVRVLGPPMRWLAAALLGW